MPRARWLAVIAAVGLLATGLSAAATVPANATSAIPQSGPFEVGNLLDYANSDFEGATGDWVNVSNAQLTDDTHHFLHNDSLLITNTCTSTTCTSPSTTSFKLAGIQINLTPGSEYRVGAYFETSGTQGETVQFSLGCYDSLGNWLGWVNGTVNDLLTTTNWQYSEDEITVPPNSTDSNSCAYVLGSPKVTLGGLANGAAVNMDEAVFAPYRAAQLIGADDPCTSATSCDWKTQNAIDTTGIGPLQTEKEFYGADTTLPSSWSDSSNDCYNIEQVYSGDQSKWPLCIIAFQYDARGTVQSEAEIESFLAGMPAGQQVAMVFWQEAEDTYTGTSGQFVSDFETEASNIRAAAAADHRTQNVLVAQDSATSQYYNGDGVGCGWIVRSGYTDYYLADHYTRDETSGGASMPSQPSPYGDQWTGWLNCVKGNNKPIGLAEYGMCSGGPSLCKGRPCPGGTSNTSDITASIADDNTYLAGDPGGTEPVVLWSNWQYPTSCDYLTPGGAQALQWQSNENQNGGAVNNN